MYDDVCADWRDKCDGYKNDSFSGLLGCDRPAGHSDDHYDVKKDRRF